MATAMLPLKHKLLGALLPENLGFTVAKVFGGMGKGGWMGKGEWISRGSPYE